MAAKAKQTIKIRRQKTGGKTGYRTCNMCHGTGRVKTGKR
jgi:cytochrome c5